MFEKLKSLFKSSDKPKKKTAQQTNRAKTSGNNAKPKVQPTRIVSWVSIRLIFN